MLSGHGGIGRRVRLRGVWLHRPSSSLGDRTTKKKARTFRAFSFSADTEACVRYFARRIFAQLGLRPTDRKQRETQAQSICGHRAQRT